MNCESPKYLSECLSYEPSSGELTWRIRPEIHFANARVAKCINTRNGNKAAGSIAVIGYLTIRLSGRLLFAHRIAWILSHGRPIPPGMVIDHINQDKLDNRLSNLRLATKAQNGWNAKRRRPETPKGVHYDKTRNSYQVRVISNGRHMHRRVKTLEEATALATSFREQLHGEFASGG